MAYQERLQLYRNAVRVIHDDDYSLSCSDEHGLPAVLLPTFVNTQYLSGPFSRYVRMAHHTDLRPAYLHEMNNLREIYNHDLFSLDDMRSRKFLPLHWDIQLGIDLEIAPVYPDIPGVPGLNELYQPLFANVHGSTQRSEPEVSKHYVFSLRVAVSLDLSDVLIALKNMRLDYLRNLELELLRLDMSSIRALGKLLPFGKSETIRLDVSEETAGVSLHDLGETIRIFTNITRKLILPLSLDFSRCPTHSRSGGNHQGPLKSRQYDLPPKESRLRELLLEVMNGELDVSGTPCEGHGHTSLEWLPDATDLAHVVLTSAPSVKVLHVFTGRVSASLDLEGHWSQTSDGWESSIRERISEIRMEGLDKPGWRRTGHATAGAGR